MGSHVVAVSVAFDDDRASDLTRDWDPGLELVVLRSAQRSVAAPILAYVNSPEVQAHGRIIVLIPQFEPRRWRHQLLQNQPGVLLTNVLPRDCNTMVSTLPFRLHE
jgi:hypothetical protein